MSNKVLIKRSSNSGVTPTSLEYGELAINTADSTLFYKDNNNSIKSFSLIQQNVVTSIAGRFGDVVLTKNDVGLLNVDNTADSTKNVLSATKLTTPRTISVSGDVVGSISFDGSSDVTISTVIQPNSVTLGTDTTGNYVSGVTAGSGITITGTAGEGWSPTISHSDTSSASNIAIDNSNGNVIQDIAIAVDTYGHVTTLTASSYDLDNRYYTEAEVQTSLPQIGFNTSSGVTVSQGQIAWNADERTLDIGLGSGVTLQAGQEQLIGVQNNTGATITNGTVCMYASSIGNSGKMRVKPFDGTNTDTLVGIATEDILDGYEGFVTTFGKIRGINTLSWGAGDILYTTSSGTLTNVEPVSGIKLPVAVVISSSVTGTIFVRVTDFNRNQYEPANTNIQSHISNVSNPHGVTKAQVGLGSVDNTADSTKNVLSATKLTTPRTINGVSFDGSSNITITDSTKQPLDNDLTAIAALSGTSGFLKKTATDTWTLDTSTYVTSSGVTSVTGTAPIVSSGGTTPTISISAATTSAAGSMSATDKTKLDAISGTNTGDETATTIKSKLGISTLSGSNTGDQTITLTGDVTGSGTGSFATTLSNSGVTAGTYTKVTVDAKGRVTTGSTLSASDVPTLNQSTTGNAATATLATTATTANALNTSNAYTGASFNSITALSSTTPSMNGTAAVGTSTTVARADHVHASDTSKASLSGATFTGAVSGTTFTGTTFTGALSGNATTATTLQTARLINGVSFNGSANINIEDRIGTAIASAATTTIGSSGLGDYIHITGTTAITSFGTASTAGIRRTLIFDSAGVVVTHNSTSLICPGATSITTVDGTVIEVIAETTSNWRVVSVTHQSVSHTELGYLDGVTSGIQTQLDSKVTKVTSTDNALVRFDGTTGGVQNSSVIVDDNGNVAIGGDLSVSNLTANASITIGTGGNYVAGSIFSDSAWGMIFRAKQASPTNAIFRWADAYDTELFRWNGSALTCSVTGNAGTATTLATSRTFQTNLASTSSVPFDGSANVTPGVTGTLAVTNGGTGTTTSTGSGSVVLSTSPTLVAPSLGVATGTSFNSITALSSTTPVMNGTAAVGTSTTVARADHVHASDTSKASLSGATFTGAVSGTSFSATTFTGALSGNATTATTATNLSGGSISATSGTFSGDLSVTGNLTINGTSTTINSASLTLDDPILTLGGDTAPTVDDNKDRGIEFRWHNGTTAKVGFFGYDDSSGAFTFIPEATNTSEVFSGTVGNAVFSAITGTTGTFSSTVTGTSFNSITALSSTTPVMNGTAAIGTSTTVARADHVHASDTSKASLSGATFTGAVSGTTFSGTSFNSITALSSTTPLVAGTAAIGTSTTVARADHVHPVQTSVSGNAGTATVLATSRTIQTNLASTSSSSFDGSANVTPGVTGTLPVTNGGTGTTTSTGSGSVVLSTSPTLVTPVLGVATGTSFNSITALSSTTPLMNGTAAVGTSTTVARADHVHASDTSKASLDSPALTGTPLAPTASTSTNTTQIATTAFVQAQKVNTVLTGTPTTPTAVVGTNTTQIASTAYVKAEINNETYSKTQLNAGQLDNRYYTETELNSGVLDTRYYTEAEIDTKLAAQNDASEIVVVPTGNLASTNVQAALVELQADINNRYTKSETDTLLAGKVDDSEIASVNLLRVDRYLAAQNIANMTYVSGDLAKIQYNTATDVDYETLGYTSGNLTSINHYVGSVLKGTTTLSYTAGNLTSAVFVGV